MSSSKKTLSQEIASLAGGYLFNTPKDESDALNMRTRINAGPQLKTMMYYGVLAKSLHCESAGEIKDLMQQLFISSEGGKGRQEAVDTLRQNLPKKVEVDRGFEVPDV
jgi:hypothetical protein